MVIDKSPEGVIKFLVQSFVDNLRKNPRLITGGLMCNILYNIPGGGDKLYYTTRSSASVHPAPKSVIQAS